MLYSPGVEYSAILLGNAVAETVTALAFESVDNDRLAPAIRVTKSFKPFNDLTT